MKRRIELRIYDEDGIPLIGITREAELLYEGAKAVIQDDQFRGSGDSSREAALDFLGQVLGVPPK